MLYGAKDFGFIYNILLPFSASQELEYAAAKNKGGTEVDNYKARRDILDQIQAKDLRSAWFCEEDSAENYSYKAEGSYYNNGKPKGENTYLFFEEQTGANKNADKYESLTQYAGLYPYNGTATYNDGEWTFKANSVTIDGFLGEMEGYINYLLGTGTATGAKVAAYYDDDKDTGKTFLNEDEKIDYSKFLYYEGKVTLNDTARKDFFYAGTETEKNDSYLALSAVNELMFAYSTDPGCLNSYMGYVVSPYKTSFVSEFEYAAQYAVQQGVGTYVVAPSDYGWHIIFVTFKFDGGEVYEGGFVPADVEIEGTFSNLFYDAMESTSASNYAAEKQSVILNACKDSFKLFEKRYKDLLNLD